MKNFVLLIIFLLFNINTVYSTDDYMDIQQAPELFLSGAYIIDLKPYRNRIEDNIVLFNKTKAEKIVFTVFFINYKTGKWVKNQNQGIIEFRDRDTVAINKGIELDKIPYIAILPNPEGNYTFKMYPKSNDIYIEVVDISPSSVNY